MTEWQAQYMPTRSREIAEFAERIRRQLEASLGGPPFDDPVVPPERIQRAARLAVAGKLGGGGAC